MWASATSMRISARSGVSERRRLCFCSLHRTHDAAGHDGPVHPQAHLSRCLCPRAVRGVRCHRARRTLGCRHGSAAPALSGTRCSIGASDSPPTVPRWRCWRTSASAECGSIIWRRFSWVFVMAQTWCSSFCCRPGTTRFRSCAISCSRRLRRRRPSPLPDETCGVSYRLAAAIAPESEPEPRSASSAGAYARFSRKIWLSVSPRRARMRRSAGSLGLPADPPRHNPSAKLVRREKRR